MSELLEKAIDIKYEICEEKMKVLMNQEDRFKKQYKKNQKKYQRFLFEISKKASEDENKGEKMKKLILLSLMMSLFASSMLFSSNRVRDEIRALEWELSRKENQEWRLQNKIEEIPFMLLIAKIAQDVYANQKTDLNFSEMLKIQKLEKQQLRNQVVFEKLVPVLGKQIEKIKLKIEDLKKELKADARIKKLKRKLNKAENR